MQSPHCDTPALSQLRASADALADCAYAAVRLRYPHKLDHLILHEKDQPLPREIHPVFDGSYDWHSSVHMHWSLLRLAALAPDLRLRPQIEAHFDERFSVSNVERERAYAAQAGRASFERPYGWAWLLALQAELDTPPARTSLARRADWGDALRPFAVDVAQRMAAFLGRSHYPVRAGTHANSAFAMLLSRSYALGANDEDLLRAIDASALRWFSADADYPVRYEPGGADFLSAGLCEALLMQRVDPAGFDRWWTAFAPRDESTAGWLQPAVVSDRVDPQLVHLDGLNLSRAWCLRELAPFVPPTLAERFSRAAALHWAAAWPHVTTGDFAATHWLASFALLAAMG